MVVGRRRNRRSRRWWPLLRWWWCRSFRKPLPLVWEYLKGGGGDRKKELELWCTVAAVESKPRCKGLSCGVGLVISGSRRASSVNSLANFDALRRSVQCSRYLPSRGTWLGLAQVLSTTLTRAQFMLVVVVDFLEDGGLSRCVVFCWWWI